MRCDTSVTWLKGRIGQKRRAFLVSRDVVTFVALLTQPLPPFYLQMDEISILCCSSLPCSNSAVCADVISWAYVQDHCVVLIAIVFQWSWLMMYDVMYMYMLLLGCCLQAA